VKGNGIGGRGKGVDRHGKRFAGGELMCIE
jgi:hypothetical protein